MAVTSDESQIIQAMISSPRDMVPSGEKHSRARIDICRIEISASPGAGLLARLTRLKAHDRVTRITHYGDADANMTDVNVGIYVPVDGLDNPVAIDADGLCDGADLHLADAVGEEILGTGIACDNFGKALWEYCAGGPATDPGPGVEYEIVAQVVGDPVGSTHCFVIEYVHGD